MPHIELSPADEAYLRYLIESGEIKSLDELVKTTLQQHKVTTGHVEKLRGLIQEGLDSPIVGDWSEESFKAEMREKLK